MSNYKNPDSQIVKELLEMQRLYHNSEYEFLLFHEIVPYSHNQLSIYSPKLVSILQEIGPQIYGMFKILSKQLVIASKKSDKFPKYFKTLNKRNLLSSQSLVLLENNKIRTPFKFKITIPEWWDAYNTVKHELPTGIFEAKYKHVIDALGALFILHHVADTIQRKKSAIFENADIIDSSNWLPVFTRRNYIYYRTKTAINSTLYESIPSKVFSISKRFLPHLKEHKVRPNPQ